jgi:hypothetical protein
MNGGNAEDYMSTRAFRSVACITAVLAGVTSLNLD